ncbi:MAG TPA: hypothetical protein VL978_08680 [Puia sp.]|nr:hypothetical protein [Puia sp.]
MKFSRNRAIAFAVIVPAFLLATASCKKSNNTNIGGTMTASLNDTAWTANYAVGGIYTQIADQFEIVGARSSSGDTTSFYLSFSTPFSVNQSISSDTSSLDVQYIDTKSGVFFDGGNIAGHSLLTVTTYDLTNLKIGGTFSGVLYNVVNSADSLVITGGTFNTAFTLQ